MIGIKMKMHFLLSLFKNIKIPNLYQNKKYPHLLHYQELILHQLKENILVIYLIIINLYLLLV